MKPDKEEFNKDYNEAIGNKSTKVKILAAKYGKTIRTIYRYVDDLIDGISDADDTPEVVRKDWANWVDDYSDPEDEYPAYEQSFTLKEDSLIIALADTHFGSKSLKHQLKALDKLVSKVNETDDAYIIFTGDLIDYGPSSPRGLQQEE